ncbi:MAG TPA: hypothetical protein VN963_00985 [bacterium]|nr:hypothetical protein [bacterium]
MTGSLSSRILRAALFTLVPLAYFSFWFWQPVGDSYSRSYSWGLQWMCIGLMASVFLVSILSWRKHQYRLLAAFGFLVCFLWLAAFLLLPTL